MCSPTFHPRGTRAIFDPNGRVDDLKKALAERVLTAEMDHHLAGEAPGNRATGEMVMARNR
jgi:transposase-like protein